MENILEATNLKILESISLVDSLFAFDLDGALAPMSSHFSQAVVQKEINELMKKISLLIPTAVISGRSLENVRAMIEFTPRYLFGNHGIEGLLDEDKLNKAKIKCRVWKHYLMDYFYVNLFPLGVILEDNNYSLSFHYGNTRSVLNAEKIIGNMLKLLPEEATVLRGKHVVNILPLPGISKSTALMEILNTEKKKFCFYVGHDDTSEEIFSQNDPYWLTVRVEQSATSKAKFYLNAQSDIQILLKKIISFLER